MDITIKSGKLTGEITVIPSKSQAHRLLICSAFSNSKTTLHCPSTNQDIEATADCLRAIGADIKRTKAGYDVTPISNIPQTAMLYCRESGSTLRFMLPIVGALGIEATFVMEGRLPQRPLSPLWEEMERMGCTLTRPTQNTVKCSGRLRAGTYTVDGGVSSQYITGLLYAMALIDGVSDLRITGSIQSLPYIQMTQQALSQFGVCTDDYHVKGSYPFQSPGTVYVEGDWSNGAFWLAANALGSSLTVNGLDTSSMQGDKASAGILKNMDSLDVIDAADIPDLVPMLAVVAGQKKRIKFTNIQRLRLKESDRVASVAAMLRNLGADVHVSEDDMTVIPGPYRSCTIDAVGDHRIAMAGAIAATVADGPVTILGANCVSKSYPSFWDAYKQLGGSYEQHIR